MTEGLSAGTFLTDSGRGEESTVLGVDEPDRLVLLTVLVICAAEEEEEDEGTMPSSLSCWKARRFET